ncbi:MAG: MG2 domain-containing protein [Lentisphaeria bacterium]|nr:MG2 domain-containing protein [Lentisphaeria bacterium]
MRIVWLFFLGSFLLSANTPMKWSYIKEGYDALTEVELKQAPASSVADRRQLTDSEQKKLEEFRKKFNQLLSQEKVDFKELRKLFKRFIEELPITTETSQFGYNYCGTLMRFKDKLDKDDIIADLELFSEKYLKIHNVDYYLRQITGQSVHLSLRNSNNVPVGQKAKLFIYSRGLRFLNIDVYKVDPNKMLQNKVSLKTPAAYPGMKKVYSKKLLQDLFIRDRRSKNEVEMKTLPVGLYMVHAHGEYINQTMLFNVSDLSAMTISDGKILILQGENTTGHKKQKLDFTIIEGSHIVASGSTNEHGLFVAKLKGIQKNYQVLLTDGKQYAVTDLNFGRPYNSQSNRSYLYTDRPIYRPGQKVHLNFMARYIDKFLNASVPQIKEVNLVIRDRQWKEIHKEKIKLDDFGSFAVDWEIPETIKLGTYFVEVNGNLYARTNIQIQEYKKPEFEVMVSSDTKTAILGDDVEMLIQADYYFGEPVPGAEVTYEIHLESIFRDVWFWKRCGLEWYMDNHYYNGHYMGRGKWLQNGKGKLDKNGQLKIIIPGNSFKNETDANIYKLKVIARVTDLSRRQINGIGELTLSRAAIQLDVRRKSWTYDINSPVGFELVLSDNQRQPVNGTIRVQVFDDGDKELSSESITINSEKNNEYKYRLSKPGRYRFLFTSQDQKERKVKQEVYIWVYEQGWYPYFRFNGMKLESDKPIYIDGEKAKIKLTAENQNLSKLLLVKGDVLLGYEMFEKPGNQYLSGIDIHEKLAPNIDLQAISLAPSRMQTASLMLTIPPKHKWLTVKVESASKVVKPGAKHQYKLIVQDHIGNPVKGRFTVSLVDESIFALAQSYRQDIRKAFYPLHYRWFPIQTSYQFRSEGKLKKGGSLARAKSMDTPAMNFAAEEAMEMDAEAGNIMHKRKEFKKAPARVRSEFKDTAYWNANIETNENGEADIVIQMPDNLTEWRMNVIAMDEKGRVGEVQESVVTRQNLMVRLQYPRTFTEGDEVTLSAIMNNYLDNEQEVEVKFELPPGLKVMNGQLISYHKLAANAEKRIDLRCIVSTSSEALLRVFAYTAEESDAEEKKIDIVPYGVKVVTGKSGLGDIQYNAVIPDKVNVDASELTISIAPSLAGPIFDGLDYLARFPYGCVEQTTNKFLPNLVVERAIKKLDLASNDHLDRIPEYVNGGMNRLMGMQKPNGSWGWWSNDQSNAYLSAYVMYGLSMAEENGYTLNLHMKQSGIKFLKEALRKEENADNAIFIMYTLSRFNELDLSYVRNHIKMLNKLSDYSVSLLILTSLKYDQYKKEVHTKFVPELLSRLKGGGGMKSLGDQDAYKHWSGSQIQSTAFGLRALMAVDAGKEHYAAMINFLIHKKSNRYWRSTKDTANAIFALTDFMLKTNEIQADYSVDLLINGKVEDRWQFSGNALKLSPKQFSLPKGLKSGEYKIELVKKGQGNLYYDIDVNYFSIGDELENGVSKGVQIKRKYWQVTKQWDGNQLKYKRQALTALKSGDLIEVEVIVNTPKISFYMLEDYLPAGCEFYEENPQKTNSTTPYWYRPYLGNREKRDDRMVFFGQELTGEKTFTYRLRCETPGKFNAMPAHIEAMYNPEQNASSKKMTIDIAK